jgi:hypothetical protein
MKSRATHSIVCLATCFFATHCASGRRVQTVPNFSGGSLKSRALLILPIAVTDDFGDERTGIVLDHESRERATKQACDSASELRGDIKIVCFDRPELAKSSAFLEEILFDYARDKTIPAERWRELERRTGAGFVLLFRPEGVRASQEVSKGSKGVGPIFIPLSSVTPVPGVITPPIESVGPKVESVRTSRTYTLSSSLVDLQNARIVRTGRQTAGASTSTAEAPDAPAHIHGIVRDLIEGMLDD